MIPLDEDRRWYRYHHLFADFLIQRLLDAEGTTTSALYIRASRWYEADGQFEEAIHYALLAADFAQAAHLMEQIGSPC